MNENSLEVFAKGASADWGPLSTEVIAALRGHMETLLRSSRSETWLDELYRDLPANKELVRHPQQGFILQAHTESEGLYRPPHDHGRSWVIYAVLEGVSEMGSYAHVEDADRSIRLVKHDSTLVRPGQVQVYLPGDIHDTRCVRGPAILYRFTERDLKKEDQEHHRLTRYIERSGVWTTP